MVKGRPGFAMFLAFAGVAFAARPALAAGEEAGPSKDEVEAWLDARAVTGTRDVGSTDPRPEAPPPPPSHRGLVVEVDLGALGHLGAMKTVSPVSPWFHALVGYEVFDWAMVLAEGDVSFGDTSYASPPPDPRTYALYGFGAGVRFTARFLGIGLFAQGSIGAARITEDILEVYGFRAADELNPYFGAVAGFEWYQVSPHYALALHGGVRNYRDTFERIGTSETPLAWHGSAALRYTF